MKIGIFDSGLGGLFVAKGIMRRLPQYDYIYLGDTAHLPYGTRSQQEIYRLTCRGLAYLFDHGCVVVILACNTASSRALRRVQREFLPRCYPDRRVLGMIIPSVEAVLEHGGRRVGVLATPATVSSKTFVKQFKLADKRIAVYQESAPLLVPMIEYNATKWTGPIVASYLAPLLQKNIDAIVLGCTHYCILKPQVRRAVGSGVAIVSQADLIPAKTALYLRNHPRLERRLSRGRNRTFLVTRLTPAFRKTAGQWFGRPIALKQISY
jgi:glutamate racemase